MCDKLFIDSSNLNFNYRNNICIQKHASFFIVVIQYVYILETSDVRIGDFILYRLPYKQIGHKSNYVFYDYVIHCSHFVRRVY